MQPTKCYRVAGYAITDSNQLLYLNRYFIYMLDYFKKKANSNEDTGVKMFSERIKETEQAMKKGIHNLPLMNRKEFCIRYDHFPDVIVQLQEGDYFFPGKKPKFFKEEGFYEKVSGVPNFLPTFKISSIKTIKLDKNMDENEKLFCTKRFYIEAKIKFNNTYSYYTFVVIMKKEMYICIESVFTNVDTKAYGQIFDYLKHTKTYQELFFQQFFKKRLDLVLLGYGDFLTHKELPVITMPKPINK